MPYQFEWDADKAAANLPKHGVSFDEAVTAFGDPLSVLLPDPDHSLGEERYLVLGMSNASRLLVVSFVERAPRTRIITARLATKRERQDYEEGQG
ncbi:MAG: BrnT family toxin [Gemmatimonadales bacterium]